MTLEESCSGYIYIPKWKKFQHPDATRSSHLPWIKDYVDQLHHQEYLDLPLAYRAGLQDIRRLVAEHGQGRCSARADYLQKHCSWPAGWAQKIVKRLSDEGWIEVRASKARAPVKHKTKRGSKEPLEKERRASASKPQAAAAAREKKKPAWEGANEGLAQLSTVFERKGDDGESEAA